MQIKTLVSARSDLSDRFSFASPASINRNAGVPTITTCPLRLFRAQRPRALGRVRSSAGKSACGPAPFAYCAVSVNVTTGWPKPNGPSAVT